MIVLCGYLYWQISDDIEAFQNRMGLFFFILALFGFSTLTSLNIFASERILFVRERANGYYSPITYFAAKVLPLPSDVLIVGHVRYYSIAGPAAYCNGNDNLSHGRSSLRVVRILVLHLSPRSFQSHLRGIMSFHWHHIPGIGSSKSHRQSSHAILPPLRRPPPQPRYLSIPHLI
jgi:hypothetical protein